MAPLTRSYFCGASSTQIIYQTIGRYFDEIVQVHPDNPALIVRHQGVSWTYRELQARVDHAQDRAEPVCPEHQHLLQTHCHY